MSTDVDKQLEEAREEARKARVKLYELQRQLVDVEEKCARFDARRKQLEEIVASSFARSVRMLSGAQKQIGASQDAAAIVSRIEDHFRAMRLITENAVPASSVEAALRFLLPHWVRPALVETKPTGAIERTNLLEDTTLDSTRVVDVEAEVVDDAKPTPLLPLPDTSYSVRPDRDE